MPLREVKKETMVNFIWTHLIYQYGVPRYIITDNGHQMTLVMALLHQAPMHQKAKKLQLGVEALAAGGWSSRDTDKLRIS